MLQKNFFNRDTCKVAQDLLGKVIHKKNKSTWLSTQIIETEAYYKREKGSHASLGFTLNRKALFMPPGTIYMYYARGADSLNISCRGEGNAVLIKSGFPYQIDNRDMIETMQILNPPKNVLGVRQPEKLCSGQTLLCKSMKITVPDWNQKQFDQDSFYIEDVGYSPDRIIQARRLGIPEGRGEHLQYRFIDYQFSKYCTENPLTKRKWTVNTDFLVKSQAIGKSID